MLILTAHGNLGQDAKTITINGKNYISFRLCSTNKHGGKETATWVSVLCRDAPNRLPYLTKGQGVMVSGEMTLSSYTNKEGKEQKDVSIFANSLTLVGKGQVEQGQEPEPPIAKNNQMFNNDDELPF